MDTDIKKIRVLAFVGLALLFFECIFGMGVLFSGLMYRGFEKDKAFLKLEMIKASDRALYDRITGDQDSLAKADFYAQFWRYRNPIMVSGGFLMLVFTLINAIPYGLMVRMTKGKQEIPVPEGETEVKEGGNAPESPET